MEWTSRSANAAFSPLGFQLLDVVEHFLIVLLKFLVSVFFGDWAVSHLEFCFARTCVGVELPICFHSIIIAIVIRPPGIVLLLLAACQNLDLSLVTSQLGLELLPVAAPPRLPAFRLSRRLQGFPFISIIVVVVVAMLHRTM